MLRANRKLQQAARPGIMWTEMQLLAEREVLRGLQELGIIKEAADIEELVK